MIKGKDISSDRSLEVAAHFDKIASRYEREVPAHVRAHLLNKFWKLSSDWVPKGSRLLDIGCGHGVHVDFFHSMGIRAKGVDFSEGMIRSGKKFFPQLKDHLSKGDATNLKFDSEAFDAASLIGVLHHLPNFHSQLEALREALRVVKPGGYVIIRECNHLNPLFKIYWNYLFPLTSRIDRFGGENWISAEKIRDILPDNFVDVTYFTFISNVSPKSLFPLLTRIESKLESSSICSYAAHYLLVLKK